MDEFSSYNAGDKRKLDVIVLQDEEETDEVQDSVQFDALSTPPPASGEVTRTEVDDQPPQNSHSVDNINITAENTNHDDDDDTILAALKPSPKMSKSKPKRCEMCNPETKEVINTFESCSQADREAGIARGNIARACRNGGGIVHGYYFRYASVDRKEMEENKAVSPTQDGRTTPQSGTSLNAPMSKSPEQRLVNLRKRNNVSSSIKSKTSPRLSKQGWDETKNLSDHNDSGPPSSAYFDVTKLKPLKSSASMKKKYVELFCKGNNKVIVCFRGNNDASAALSLDREVVIKMCDKKKTLSGPNFPSFSLSYKSSKMNPSCYQYGIHSEDSSGVREKYADRLKRWEVTYAKERQHLPEENVVDSRVRSTSASSRTSHKQRRRATPKDIENGNPPTEEVPISMFFNDKTIDQPDMLCSIRSPDELLNRDYGNLCIVCQKRNADVLFQPCSHAVICFECYNMNHCKIFCPICRTKISSATRVSHLKIVKPRIYSAYSFMD